MARLKIEIAVPAQHAEAVVDALAAAGAGRVGNYDRVASMWPISGTWRPLPGADPYDGEIGVIARGTEMRVESVCDEADRDAVLAAVRAVHPYEEPVVNFIQLYEP
jgi:hypothetical protein